MAPRNPVEALTPFGFTGLEAEVYAFLLGESPATGYRISQGIAKPVANTYKAIQTLQAKGAVVVEEGESRLCRAVPSDELLDRLTREFETRQKAAKEYLKNLGTSEADQRVYVLRAFTQAMHRLRTMLDSASQVALLCAPSDVVQSITDELNAATTRGISVTVKTDAEVALSKAEVFVATRSEDLLRTAPFVRLIVDGTQLLAGVVAPDRTEALWTSNPVFALLQHEGLAAEITSLELAERIEDGAGPKRLARALVPGNPASKTAGAAAVD